MGWSSSSTRRPVHPVFNHNERLDRGVRALKALRQSIAQPGNPDLKCQCGGEKYANQLVCRTCWPKLPSTLRDQICRYQPSKDTRAAIHREALDHLKGLKTS